MELVVRTFESISPASQEVEVVERKGLCHPDTICDAVAETSARACVATTSNTSV